VITAYLSTASAVLEAAADILKARGWCHGRDSATGKTGPVDVLGAINVAVGLPPDGRGPIGSLQAEAALIDAQLMFQHYVGQRLDTWNDAPGRTRDEVIGALRGCVAVLAGAS
jgi:anthranilate phosphoribosyltransferase